MGVELSPAELKVKANEEQYATGAPLFDAVKLPLPPSSANYGPGAVTNLGQRNYAEHMKLKNAEREISSQATVGAQSTLPILAMSSEQDDKLQGLIREAKTCLASATSSKFAATTPKGDFIAKAQQEYLVLKANFKVASFEE